jgi:chemotaxis protein MotB
MRRKKHEDEHENLERWLITYADLITLLLAFFIMMYTFSKQDAQKYQEVSERLRVIFTGGTGILKTGSSGTSAINPLGKTGSDGEMKKQLENEVKAMTEITGDNKISVFKDERGLVVRIMDTALFDEGRAELKEKAKTALKKIVPTLKSGNNQIRVEGHTDNRPINTSEFGSNWELSTRRATEVVRHLLEAYDFPPQRISASGYAEYRPVAANDSTENRAFNRRIEIVLMETAVKTSLPQTRPQVIPQ